MTDNTKNRYELENLPISEETRKGLTQENINYIGAVGRMLSLQDDFIEESIANQSKAMFLSLTKQNNIIKSIQRVIVGMQDELRDHEKRIKNLEKRLLEHLEHYHSEI